MAQETVKCNIRSLDIDKKIISNVDNGILILDYELNIYYYNRWLEIHTGIKESDALTKKLYELFSEIKIKTLKRKINTALRLGTPTFYTATTSKYLIPIEINQIKISSYSYMQQDVSIIPFDQEKKLVTLIITDQTQMSNTNTLLEKNIAKIEELNSELIKERETIDSKVLLIKFNLTNIITNVSNAYLNLLQHSKSDLIDIDLFHYRRLTISKELREKISFHIDEKKVFKFESKDKTQKDKELTLSHTLVPEYDTNGKHIGFILFMEDITAAKKVIEQQEKLLITSRSAAMGEMISMIAHQWRQPLSVVNTIIATMRVKQELEILDIKTTEESFEKIEETVQYLSTTIDDFRNYFKPNKVIKEVFILDIIKKSTAFLLLDIKQLDIKYTQELDSKLKIFTYKNELIQCIINIIKNSIDAFKENSINGQYIKLSVRQESSLISISIVDNAGGISKEVLKKIFEPYFSTKAKNGTGLGLYIAKTIIEEHLNGKITITSSNKKTKVLMELPLYLSKKKEKICESSAHTV